MFQYIKEAFKIKPNLLALAGGIAAAIVLHKLTLGVLTVVFGLEMLFLVSMAANARFQRVVRAKKEQESFRKDRLRMEGDLFRMAEGRFRNRYLALRKSIENIWRNIQQSSSQKEFLRTIRGNLEKLQNQYLRLVFSLGTLDRYIRETEAGKIDADIANLSIELESATGSLRELKEQRIQILKKRKEKMGQAAQNREILASQLDVIEETVKLLIEPAITSYDPDIVSRQIEKIIVEAETATDSMREFENFINVNGTFQESEILEVSKKIRNL